MRVIASDAESGRELCSTDVTDFVNDCYLVFQVKGTVTFTINRIVGANAVLQGVFLDPVVTQ